MTIKLDPIHLGAEGYYSLAVYKADGTEVKEKRIEHSDNVVTYNGAFTMFFDIFYDFLGSYEIVIGTGTTERTRSSSGLGTKIAQSGTTGAGRVGNEVDNGDGTNTCTNTRSFAFSLGAIVGTISEIGIQTPTDVFIAGQLIKDEFGNPTTITLLADEQLVAQYTTVVTYPNGNPNGTAPIISTGTITTPTEGTVNWTGYVQPLFSEYEIGLSTESIRYALTNRSYVTCNSSGIPVGIIPGTDRASKIHDGVGNVTVDYTRRTAAPSDFASSDIKFINVGGQEINDRDNGINPTNKIINSSQFSNFGSLVIEFDVPLTKTSSDSFTLHVQQTFTV